MFRGIVLLLFSGNQQPPWRFELLYLEAVSQRARLPLRTSRRDVRRAPAAEEEGRQSEAQIAGVYERPWVIPLGRTGPSCLCAAPNRPLTQLLRGDFYVERFGRLRLVQGSGRRGGEEGRVACGHLTDWGSPTMAPGLSEGHLITPKKPGFSQIECSAPWV